MRFYLFFMCSRGGYAAALDGGMFAIGPGLLRKIKWRVHDDDPRTAP
jgi:hypothetical protein